MTGEVVDILAHASKLHIAMQRHPAGKNRFTVDGLAQIPDPAGTLTQVARVWERLHRDLTAGPGALDTDDAYAALQVMVTALVHPAARKSLIFTWQQLVDAVGRLNDVMDGDTTRCSSYAEAVGRADADLSWELYPLVHGAPARDACPDCIRTCQSVNSWQTRLGCTNHGGR